MGRLILIIVAALAVVTFVVALGRVGHRTATGARAVLEEGNVPNSIKTLSFILLIVLMFGVVTGWFGGL